MVVSVNCRYAVTHELARCHGATRNHHFPTAQASSCLHLSKVLKLLYTTSCLIYGHAEEIHNGLLSVLGLVYCSMRIAVVFLCLCLYVCGFKVYIHISIYIKSTQ